MPPPPIRRVAPPKQYHIYYIIALAILGVIAATGWIAFFLAAIRLDVIGAERDKLAQDHARATQTIREIQQRLDADHERLDKALKEFKKVTGGN